MPRARSCSAAAIVQVCRDAVSTPDKGGCDLAEKCNGFDKGCPENKFDTGSVS
jgi:hypothetical protein